MITKFFSSLIAGITMLVALALLPVASVAQADDATSVLDLDVLSSVVAIEIDGKFAGTGVVVTRTGLVVTSLDFAMLRLKENKLIVIGDLRRTASVVALDEPHKLALLQMHGVIPRSAKLAPPSEQPKKSDIFVCWSQDHILLQVSANKIKNSQNVEMLTENGGACAVFGAKTGNLKAVLAISVGEETALAYFIGIAKVRKLLGPALDP